MGKAKIALLALKHTNKLPKRFKKWVWIIVGLIVALGLLLVAFIIFLIIWLAGMVTSSEAPTQIIDTAKQQVTEVQEQNLDTNPLDYIQAEQVNTQKLQDYVTSLSPQELTIFIPEFRQQVNRLLQSGQLVQEQADSLLRLLP